MRLKLDFNNKTIFWILLISSIVFLPLIFAPPLWDDLNLYRDGHFHLKPSPFRYFDILSDRYRAWPLGHTILWSLRNLFGTSLTVPHLLSILLHGLNAGLVFKLARRLQWPQPAIIAGIFMFHPLQTYTVASVMQFPNLLAFTAMLLALLGSLNDLPRAANTWPAILILANLSLLLKPAGAFFIVPILWWNQRRGYSRALAAVIAIAAGLFAFMKTSDGVRFRAPEVFYSSTFYFEAPFLASTIGDLEAAGLYPSIEDYPLLSEALARPILQIGAPVAILGQNFIFYGQKTIAPFSLFFIYSKELGSTARITLGLLGLLCVVILIWTRRARVQHDPLAAASVLLLCGFLPVSGLFYVPLMKYTFTANHWYYWQALGFAGLTVVLAQKVHAKLSLMMMIALIYFCSVAATDHYNLELSLKKNLKQVPSSVILPALLQGHNF